MTCRHRQPYGFFEAIDKASFLREHESPGSRGIRVAGCRQCRGFYLTSKPRRWVPILWAAFAVWILER